MIKGLELTALDYFGFVMLIIFGILLTLAIKYHIKWKTKLRYQINDIKTNNKKPFDYVLFYRLCYIIAFICLVLFIILVGININNVKSKQ